VACAVTGHSEGGSESMLDSPRFEQGSSRRRLFRRSYFLVDVTY
jgi:hypothetical protein